MVAAARWRLPPHPMPLAAAPGRPHRDIVSDISWAAML
jgi:hypothetical protein